MLVSRGATVLRTLKGLQSTSLLIKPAVRNSHNWYYRKGPDHPPPKSIVLAAEVFQGIAWWWVLWHLWTEPEHIIGEFPYPNASLWTDEELGIPKELEVE